MSKLQEVPLAGDDAAASADLANISQKSKTNTLKRLLKMGKKPTTQADTSANLNPDACAVVDAHASEDAEHAEPQVDELPQLETDGKEYKTNTLGRFMQRLKGKLVAEAVTPSTSSGMTLNSEGKPVPNVKPTLKSSLSSYWRNIFKRHQTASQENAVDLQDAPAAISGHELASGVAQPAMPAAEADAPAAAQKLSVESAMPEVMEEVQVLAISEDVDVVEQSLEEIN